MKTLIILSISATCAFSATESVVPEPFKKERYEETRTTSPFVLATKVVDVEVAPKEDPLANMYIVGLGRADGKEYVTVAKLGEESTPIRLFGNTPGDDGISVQQVIWSDAFGKSRVKLKKGSHVGEIGFNENAIKSAVAGSPVAPAMQNSRPPGIPAPATGFNRPTNSSIPTPASFNSASGRPGGTPFSPSGGTSIPKPTGSPVINPPAPNNGSGGATQSRQRIRVIQNK
jgi:hypothetical protein